MDAIMYGLILFIVFCLYMLFRNEMVSSARREFIEYFFYHDNEGYKAGNVFQNHIPGYDEMMAKFWVWPLDSFYPAYKNRKRK